MSDDHVALDLNGPAFYDKVYGCWVGKNAGGTLGTPLEKGLGDPEPFDVWWYPELREGGIPNDDLEMQLAWLKAVEEVGPDLTARDLARYWLDHIGYNFDEYGLTKTNLRLGLEPPVSGYFNNWFKDCMGCPIRSEIWACLAPGVPRIAVRYAYQDAICDHAGGESIFGEIFNAAVESAAFVIADRRRLIDIGLSYIPDSSRTACAIRAVLTAHNEGLDWKQARRRVLDTTPHHVAQYSPINLGFQVIGLLYGDDFGDGICKTVNCGYDTDSSGAAIGSYLGILYGASGLPAKWTDPLGDNIATNESWGGIRHLLDGANPAPRTIDQLSQRICNAAKSVLTHYGELSANETVAIADRDRLYANHDTAAILDVSPTRLSTPGPDIDVDIEYGDTPAVAPDTTKTIITYLTNKRLDAVNVSCQIVVPDGWNAPQDQHVAIPAGASIALTWLLEIPGRSALHNSNRLFVIAAPEGHPAQPAVPLVLIGAAAFRISGPYPADGHSDAALLDLSLPPESRNGSMEETSRAGAWDYLPALENAIPVPGDGSPAGALYLQTFLYAPAGQMAWLGVAVSCPVSVWVNDQRFVRVDRYGPIRPSHYGNRNSYGSVHLKRGWNEVLIKLVHDGREQGIECHLVVSSDDKIKNGQPHLGRTRFPWDLQSTSVALPVAEPCDGGDL